MVKVLGIKSEGIQARNNPTSHSLSFSTFILPSVSFPLVFRVLAQFTLTPSQWEEKIVYAWQAQRGLDVYVSESVYSWSVPSLCQYLCNSTLVRCNESLYLALIFIVHSSSIESGQY